MIQLQESVFDAVLRTLEASWRDVGYDYANLPPAEQARMSEDAFGVIMDAVNARGWRLRPEPEPVSEPVRDARMLQELGRIRERDAALVKCPGCDARSDAAHIAQCTADAMERFKGDRARAEEMIRHWQQKSDFRSRLVDAVATLLGRA